MCVLNISWNSKIIGGKSSQKRYKRSKISLMMGIDGDCQPSPTHLSNHPNYSGWQILLSSWGLWKTLRPCRVLRYYLCHLLYRAVFFMKALGMIFIWNWVLYRRRGCNARFPYPHLPSFPSLGRTSRKEWVDFSTTRENLCKKTIGDVDYVSEMITRK